MEAVPATGDGCQRRARERRVSVVAAERLEAAPGTRCLVLQLEPTPYILPRALYLLEDANLHTALFFTYLNSSQPWGRDADIGDIPVLLDPHCSELGKLLRVMRLMWRILRGDFTIAHLAGWGHWIVRMAILSCKLKGVPFSVESDSPLLPGLTGWREWLKRSGYPIWMNWIGYAIPGGTRQAAYFRYYGVADDKICVSHMTVDTEKIRRTVTPSRKEFRATRQIPDDLVLFVFVGRLLQQKGVDVLLKAFATASTQSCQIGLVVIGDGPELERVQKAAADHPGKLWSAGRADRVGVITWLRASDVFVLPSRDEHWGLVVNEAMVCGLPVIVSDACGCADDLVETGRNGHVFRVDDVAELADAMLDLAQNAPKREAMGEQSQAMIRPWTIERQAETIRSALVRMSHER